MIRHSLSLYRPAALLFAVLILAGCASREPKVARLTPDELFQNGIAAYQARNYGRALPLLEAFVARGPGDSRVPQALLTLGRARMDRKEFITAATEFQRLVTEYPSNPAVPEARFGVCEAYARLSPRPVLDQEYTRAALLHCGSVADLYPGTPQGEQAAQLIAELRGKLAYKAYQNGEYYFKRRAYDAAVIYYQDVAAEYPRTEVAPAALMRLMESYQRIGYVEEAAETRERLLREYPESAEAQALRA